MNNSTTTTTAICQSNSTEIDVIIWRIGALLLPLIGIPGQILMILTMLLSNRRRSQPTSLYFIFMSISETIYLVFMFWDWLDAVNLVKDPRQVLDCGFFYPFVRGTGFISLLLFTQLNIDRIYIIYKPQQTHSYLTRKRISRRILLVFSTLLLFFFHYRFSLHYDSKGFIIYGQSCRVYKRAHKWYYSIWPYIHLVCRLTPCVILIMCTIYIFYNRYYENNNRKNLSHRQQQKFSLVLVVLSIYILTAIIPTTILQIFNQTMWKYEFECYSCHCIENNIQAKKWKLFNTISIMWETSIYMNKFYIKFLFSSDFRYDVKKTMFY